MDKQRQLRVSLGKRHEDWLRYAAQNGERPATLLRKIAFMVLEGDQSFKLPPLPEEPRCLSIHVRLREDELEFLDRFAEQMQLTRSRALIAIIRDAIAAEPQFSGEEIQELSRSNYQLSKMGVNLNQIARALNRVDPRDPRFSAQTLAGIDRKIKQITEAITTHSGMVWKVINAGRHRLSLKGREK